jgi:hypothetical protein
MRSPARQRRRDRKKTRYQRYLAASTPAGQHKRERAYTAWILPPAALLSIWRRPS